MSSLLEVAPSRQHELLVTHSCSAQSDESGWSLGDRSLAELAAEVAEVARGIRLEYWPPRAGLGDCDELGGVW